jgi:hypothetical protein
MRTTIKTLNPGEYTEIQSYEGTLTEDGLNDYIQRVENEVLRKNYPAKADAMYLRLGRIAVSEDLKELTGKSPKDWVDELVKKSQER